MNKALLEKYFQGKCTVEEVKYILDSLETGKLDKHLAKQIKEYEIKKEKGPDLDEDRILQRVHDIINMEDLVDYVKNGDSNTEDSTFLHVHTNEGRRSIAWVRKVAMLAASVAAITLGILYLKPDSDEKQFEVVEEIKQLRKETNKGQKLTIHLSDGTEVILNSGSTISYPEVFDEDKRVVNLEGEAFFEVTHDKDRPFFVRSSNLEMKVLGTSFNVQAFPETETYNVALVTGKLMVGRLNKGGGSTDQEALLLSPGEMADLNMKSGELKKLPFDVEEITSWRRGIIYFKDADHRKVITILENWFDVEITTVGQPKEEWSLTSKFERDNLKNIMEVIQASQDITYEMKGNKVKIIFQ